MAVYKVPQDVEAEDKLIGFLSFKQFIFVIIAVIFYVVTYMAYSINFVFTIIPLPFALFFTLIGLWPRKDQPVDVYLMALVKFYFKPRKRVWSPEGRVEHVRITAPKVEKHIYTDSLSRNEVEGRLASLAQNLDTRGWASKNVGPNQISAGSPNNAFSAPSDRLVQPVQQTDRLNIDLDIRQSDDVLDVDNSDLGREFEQKMAEAAKRAREQARASMQNDSNTNKAQSSEQNQATPRYNPYGDIHQKVINPIGHEEQNPEQPKQQQTPPENQANQQVTEQRSPDIINLSQNSDLDIATIARQANKQPQEKKLQDDEEISLH